MSARSWRWALVIGLALVVIGLALIVLPYRGRNTYPGNTPLVVAVDGCQTNNAREDLSSSCKSGAQVRLGLSAASLVGGAILVAAGAIGLSRLQPEMSEG